MTRRDLLATLIPAACGACSIGEARLDADAPRRRAVDRAIRFLHSRQRTDGAWRSRDYGLLAGGDSLTAFVAQALAALDRADTAAERALNFLRSRIRANGALGMSDPGLPDYPNYSTALTLRTLVAVRPRGWRGDAARLARWLRGQQFSEENGWSRSSAPHGAWGMGGAVRRPPHAGHVDLSMTRHVLEALADAEPADTGLAADDPACRRARVYVVRCRNADGGFHFSTVVDEANKAGRGEGRWLSYGTATADGFRACRVVGLAGGGLAGRGARRWIRAHHRPDTVPGFDGHPDRRWRDGLWYYYVASAAAVLDAEQRDALVATLIGRQREDGSWSNPEPLVKEDDPLIATAFALRAIGGRPG